MGKYLLAFYGMGAMATGLSLLRPQELKHDRLMNAGAIVLWPIYWTFFMALLLINRKHP
jgi:hypothetical protein